jgi:hypothetical protein
MAAERPLKNAERNLNECIGAAGGKEVVTWMRAHADIFGVGRVPRSEIIAPLRIRCNPITPY